MDSKSPEELRGSELDRQSLYFDFSLPPLYRLEDIFKDITERALSIGPDFEFVLRFSLNRPFRVATMCSGTESPLFALNMVKKGKYRDIKQLPYLFELHSDNRPLALENIRPGLVLNFQHVFSCEILPYKQAYIERNCRPPMLFRDITEMGNDQA